MTWKQCMQEHCGVKPHPSLFLQILKKSIHDGKHIEIKREIPPNLYNAKIIRTGALTEKKKKKKPSQGLRRKESMVQIGASKKGIHYAGISSKGASGSSRQINLLQFSGIQHSLPTPSRIL